jgi:predicted nucleic acid-binding protein
MAISAVTASELLVGVHRARTDEQRVRRSFTVEEILGSFPIVPFDVSAARIHARLAADLITRGQLIGAHDLLIAATALANGYGILTANSRDFRRIPGLTVHEPEW